MGAVNCFRISLVAHCKHSQYLVLGRFVHRIKNSFKNCYMLTGMIQMYISDVPASIDAFKKTSTGSYPFAASALEITTNKTAEVSMANGKYKFCAERHRN